MTPHLDMAGWRESSAGISVSIVTFELGTIRPTRYGVIGRPRYRSSSAARACSSNRSATGCASGTRMRSAM